MTKRNRSSIINIRVTDYEKQRIVHKATKAGLTTSEYVRQTAVNKEIKELPRAELYDLCTEISRTIDDHDFDTNKIKDLVFKIRSVM
jgi:hypothetical protein